MRLRFTRPALSDLAEILDYIARRSPQGARSVHERLKAVLHLLCAYPGVGSPTNDPVIRRMTTHPYPYLVFYEVTDKEVIIHAVRHGASDPGGMPGPRQPST